MLRTHTTAAPRIPATRRTPARLSRTPTGLPDGPDNEGRQPGGTKPRRTWRSSTDRVHTPVLSAEKSSPCPPRCSAPLWFHYPIGPQRPDNSRCARRQRAQKQICAPWLSENPSSPTARPSPSRLGALARNLFSAPSALLRAFYEAGPVKREAVLGLAFYSGFRITAGRRPAVRSHLAIQRGIILCGGLLPASVPTRRSSQDTNRCSS